MYLVMWTHVRDYDDWKAAFDGGERLRREYRCTGHEIYRDVEDPQRLTVFLEFPSRERARSYFDDPRFEEQMREGGAEPGPRTMFVSQAQRTDYRLRRPAA
jgi:hypothetical protein